MTKACLTITTALAAFAALSAAPAMARGPHGHVRTIQGANGHGLVQSRSVSRQPGSATATRSLQTNSGRGYQSTRSASWGDGSYNSSRATTANNGQTVNRTTTATNNGDGTASYGTTVTGPNGNSRGVSGTVSVHR
ncbi:MAG: hypothetical protein ABIO86_11490 [Sphingomonas sp.]